MVLRTAPADNLGSQMSLTVGLCEPTMGAIDRPIVFNASNKINHPEMHFDQPPVARREHVACFSLPFALI